MNKTAVIVMAAGAGTRFKSKKSKLLHNIAGKPTILYLSNTLKKLNPSQVIFVVSYQKEEITEFLKDYKFDFAEQKQLDGTAGAVRVGMEKVKEDINRIVVLPGDTPFIPENVIKSMMETKSPISLLAVNLDDPSGYGRIKTDAKKHVVKIIEESDLDASTKKIKLVNSSIYSFDKKILQAGLEKIKKNSKKNEYYLTDIFDISRKNNKKIECIITDDSISLLGANNRKQLCEVSKKMWRLRAEKFMDEGVSFIDADRVFLDEEVKINTDVTIYPDVFIEGTCEIGEDVTIYQGCHIKNTKIAKGTTIGPYVIIDDSVIGEDNKIGPFTHVRQGTVTSKSVKIGSFVETKKIIVGNKSKIPHLSYIGDASIGENSNIGCGVITCNYDGFNKHKTTIGNNVFVGSDCQLIAPVTLSDDTYVATGTSVTKNTEKGDMAIGRVRQENKPGYSYKLRENLKSR